MKIGEIISRYKSGKISLTEASKALNEYTGFTESILECFLKNISRRNVIDFANLRENK